MPATLPRLLLKDRWPDPRPQPAAGRAAVRPDSAETGDRSLNVVIYLSTLMAVLLFSLWLHGDGALGAPYIRFLCRSLVMAIAAAVFLAPPAALAAWILGRNIWHGLWWGRLLIVCFSAGFLANGALTVVLTSFDPEITALADASLKLNGFRQLNYPGLPPITLNKSKAYVRREPPTPIRPALLDLIRAGEDERQGLRLSSEDPRALTRAFVRTYRGVRQGGSTIAQQIAGLLFDLKTSGEPTSAFRAKITKYLLGMRVDDLYTRDQLAAMYANIVPVGAVNGVEISGIEAAARTFYGKPGADLTVGEMAEIVARFPNPSRFSPLTATETDEGAGKQAAYEHNFRRVLQRAAALHAITEEQRAEAAGHFLSTAKPIGTVVLETHRPRLKAVFEELQRLVPEDGGNAAGYLKVDVANDPHAQELLERSITQAREEIASLKNVSRNEKVLIEAVVLRPDGGIVAEVGAATIAGGCSSFVKPFVACAALEDHVVASPADAIPGMKLSVEEMLYRSVNEGSENLCTEMGPQRVSNYLQAFGFQIPRKRVSRKNCIGAGAVISVRDAAAAFSVFSYKSPSYRETPRLIASVVDGWTGVPHVSVTPVRMVSDKTALEIRAALERTPIDGTGKKCRALALAASLAMKTGTAAFFDKKKKLEGEGGSWTLASDSVTGVVMATRVRYASGHPFAPNGGDSAILVVQHFLEAYREGWSS
jgi:hypothetical protein